MAMTMKVANANTVSRSAAPAIAEVLLVVSEIGKEVEAPRDEDGAERTGSAHGSSGSWDGFDTLEVRFGAAAQFLLVEASLARRASGNERSSPFGKDPKDRKST